MAKKSIFSRIRSSIKSIFSKPQTKQLGTVYITPAEKKYAPEISSKTGATVSVPETGETYSSTTGTFVSSGSGGGSGGTSAQIIQGNIQEALKPEAKISSQQENLNTFAKTQQEYYKSQIQQNINRIGNFASLPSAQKSAIINREIARYEPEYKKKVQEYANQYERITEEEYNQAFATAISQGFKGDVYLTSKEARDLGIEIKETEKVTSKEDLSALDIVRLYGVQQVSDIFNRPFEEVQKELMQIEAEKLNMRSPNLKDTFAEIGKGAKSIVAEVFNPEASLISKYDPVSAFTGEIKIKDIAFAYKDMISTLGKVEYKFVGSKDLLAIRELEAGVIYELFPKSYGEYGLLVGTAGIYTSLPTFGRIALSSYFGVTGVKGALDEELSFEKRIASGIIGGLGFAGALFETIPFAKGTFARFTGEFKPVITAEQGFKEIKLSDTEIGLILPKSPLKEGITTGIELPKSSPLVKGGFGRTAGGEDIFLGSDQFLATSQRGLFKEGVDIPLLKEFFVTPEEPFINIPETRLSRLGLLEPFEIPKNAELGFGFLETPQIGLTIGDVGRYEGFKQFKLGTGTELEAVKSYGLLTDIKRIGVTAIKGQQVDIYSFEVGKSNKRLMEDISELTRRTTEGTSRLSGESFLSAELSSKSLSLKLKSTSDLLSSDILTSKLFSSKTTPTLDISFKSLNVPTRTPTITTKSLSLSYEILPPSTPIIRQKAPTIPRKPKGIFGEGQKIPSLSKELRKIQYSVLYTPSFTAKELGLTEKESNIKKINLTPLDLRGLPK